VCCSIAFRKLILRAVFMYNSCSSKLTAQICHPTRRSRWRASTGARTRRANSCLVMSSRRTWMFSIPLVHIQHLGHRLPCTC
jgi:hypothetical protein